MWLSMGRDYPQQKLLNMNPASYLMGWCGNNVLDWNGCLPHNRRDIKVRCKSLFTSTKWTTRNLSVREWGAAYDVPQHVLQGIDECDIPFLNATPAKLLSMALELWLPCSVVTSNTHNNQVVFVGGLADGKTQSAGSTKNKELFIPQERGQLAEQFDKDKELFIP
jgi:hypothetical protein